MVCPASLQENWRREVLKWTKLKPRLVSRKKFQWPRKNEAVIARWSNLPVPTDKDALNEYQFNPDIYPADPPDGLVVILDECHLASRTESLRYRCADALIRKLPEDACVWGLSATPMTNRPAGLWTVLGLLDLQHEFGSAGGFIASLEFDPDSDDPIGFTEEGKDKLSHIMLRQRADDIGRMPVIIPPRQVDVDVDDESRHNLDQLVEKLGGQEFVSFIMKTAKKSRERLEMETHIAPGRKLLAQMKIPALLRLIETFERNGLPVLVFSVHRRPIELLRLRTGCGGFTGCDSAMFKQTQVDKFQAGKINVLGFTGSGATGLNLSRACHMLRVDLDWNASTNRQVIGRMARLDSPHDEVQTWDLKANHFIDDLVFEINQTKTKMLESAGLL